MNTAGLRYTGMAMVSCARSEMIMPLGAGNLQKGERSARCAVFPLCCFLTHIRPLLGMQIWIMFSPVP